MATTEPIRDMEELKDFISYYSDRRDEKMERNYVLILTGLYTALRISDVLSLRWMDVMDEKRASVRDYICVVEKKTKKKRNILLNRKLKGALSRFWRRQKPKASEYIFSSENDRKKPISRVHAYRVIKEAANACIHDSENISCHSLRKTFGYHALRQGASLAVLTEIFNHSTYEVTKRYLGLTQDDQDDIIMRLDF